MSTGNTKLQLPINKSVGSQHQPVAANQSGSAPPPVAVPASAPLVINGRLIVIDVRNMSTDDVVKLINTIQGVTASIDGQGRLVISGASSIDGDASLRAILGI